MSSQPSWIGKKLSGRYEIQELLGQGGMSAVYKAMDGNLQRVVAIKLIHTHLSSDPEFVRRFEEEAKAVAQMRHLNIVQIFDFDHDGDVYYIVFEFVPGETLQDRLKRMHVAERRLDSQLLLSIGAGLADALNYAHSRGLIHRDVKPANVMLNVNNEPVLMDFGIVKIMGGTQHTATGAVMGTARYMSPEQIRGERVDERTDLYSLGVMLFEMAGGRAPFEADSAMTVMMMHVNDPVPDLRALRPNVPPALVAIINRLLAKNPDERFGTAGEVADALRAIDPHAPVVAEPTIVETAPRQTPPQPAASIPATRPAAEAMLTPAAGSAGPPPLGTGGATPATSPASRERLAAYGAIGLLGLLVLACIAGAYVIFNSGLLDGLGGGDGTPTSEVAQADGTDTPEAPNSGPEDGDDVVISSDPDSATPTSEPTATDTPAPTETVPPTDTPEPTMTATPTLTPTATVPSGIPYSRINDITLQNGTFIVEYETWEFTEALPGMHVHFFFDTVPPEQAGVPQAGPWYVWGGPRPFNGYTINDRPAAAEEMCILVANPDHSIQLESGNCYPLPEY